MPHIPTIQKRSKDKAPHLEWTYIDTIRATLLGCEIDGTNNCYIRVNQHGQEHEYEVSHRLYATMHSLYCPGDKLVMQVRADEHVKSVKAEGMTNG
jgi:hypothetical protein